MLAALERTSRIACEAELKVDVGVELQEQRNHSVPRAAGLWKVVYQPVYTRLSLLLSLAFVIVLMSPFPDIAWWCGLSQLVCLCVLLQCVCGCVVLLSVFQISDL